MSDELFEVGRRVDVFEKRHRLALGVGVRHRLTRRIELSRDAVGLR
jgi:hypothetical protein